MSKVTLFADIIIPLGVPNKYTYRVPSELNESIEEGKRVLVQFGKSKIYTGIVYALHQIAPVNYQAKYIEAILDDFPVVNKTQLKFWDWISYYYCANPGDVLNAALPSGLKLSSTSHVQLNPEFNFEEIEHGFFNDTEHKIIEILHANANISIEELATFLKLKSSHHQVNKLIKKNAVVVFEEIKDKYKPKIISQIKLNDKYNTETELHQLINSLEKRAFKQAEVLLGYLHLVKINTIEEGWINKTELAKKTDSSALNSLIKKEIFSEKQVEVDRLVFLKNKHPIKPLTKHQEEAYNKISTAFDANKISLLMGVTGSGKTEVYIKLIEKTLKENKQILFLVPEIALTTQLITRLRAVFGELVGVYHSRFSENERVEIWNNVLQNKTGQEKQYKIILAARSGLFLPFNNLGLIIIDEEHDFSFKQSSPSPRYHARDAAIFLSTLFNANVLLGTATPSLESYQNSLQGKYELIELQQQFYETGKTNIEVCDINYFEKAQNMKGVLTPPLFDAINDALKEKKQIILFQNRRGFAPYTQCNACATIPYCINCDVPLIYHKYLNKLKCHYCGYTTDSPKSCAACGSTDLRFKGLGTEKIEEEIETLFPNAKIARLDLDTTRSKYAYKQIIDDFENQETDILIGTQMVTKGLDFGNVSIVGILNADSFLNFPDFRSFEKSYQLITQLKGRAGRKNNIGKLFIQTNQKEHKVLSYILKDDIKSFYKLQLEERESFVYPPFYRLIQLNIISANADELNHLSIELAKLLKPVFQNRLLGPESPMVARIKNNYYKKILLKMNKADSPKKIREFILNSIIQLQSTYKKWKFTVQVDVDPS